MAMKSTRTEGFKFNAKGDSIEGYYLGNEAKTLQFGPTFEHRVQMEDGTTQSFLGTKLLNDELGKVPAGSLIRVTYEGEVPKKKGPGKYRSFIVEYDDENSIDVQSTGDKVQDIKNQARGA
jgi:hypothetical protein